MTRPAGDDIIENRRIELRAGLEDAGRRLDAWLASTIEGVSRHQIQLRIEAGDVRVGGELKPARYRLRDGDPIEVELPHKESTAEPLPSPIEFPVHYEDGDLLIVDKPAGLVVQPAPGHERDTLANGLLARYGTDIRDVGGIGRCGIVHRLDKLTSGLLIVAKTPAAHEALTADLAERRIDRRYIGLAMGGFRADEGTIDRPVGRRLGDRKKMGVVRDGREALTRYRVVLQADRVALVVLRLHTGRTHQIRVHLQSVGHPILADAEYGYTKKHTLSQLKGAARAAVGARWPGRQMLHAAALRFEHPRTREAIQRLSPPPEDMAAMIEIFLPDTTLDWEDEMFRTMEDAGVEAQPGA